MSCEEAWDKFLKEQEAHTRLKEELDSLMLSLVATRPSPVEPLREGSEKSRRIDYLMEEVPKAFERERVATVAFLEARKMHR